ncbi:MAG: tRNA-(ms[2]io[6]A)-hydroxylase [Polyangiaceae bacterium]
MLCLTQPTSAKWVEAALADLDAVLVDHAHCEMKAASNALSLAVRATQAPQIVSHLVALAEEELSHFRRVLGELERRGIPLGPPPLDAYAAELRKIVRAERRGTPTGNGVSSTVALVDRMLIAALIEARSCERFRLLSDALRERGPADLQALYQELLASEARHFRTFVDLAHDVARPDDGWVEGRLEIIAELEGALSSRLAGLPTIHG